MPELEIWNQKQIRQYEQPPTFSVQERKHFLSLPTSLQAKVESFHTLTNQVGFTIMVGYFLACKRFYPTEHFAENDIAFLCRRRGAWPFTFDKETYRGSTYTRHRRVILDYFGFEPFQADRHRALINEVTHEQIYSFEEPALVLNFILQWLEQRHIELPTYYSLQRMLTEAVRHEAASAESSYDFGKDVIPRLVAIGAQVHAYDFGRNRVPGEPEHAPRQRGSGKYWSLDAIRTRLFEIDFVAGVARERIGPLHTKLRPLLLTHSRATAF